MTMNLSEPVRYIQPDGAYIPRKQEGPEEQILYIPSTGIRIWYNDGAISYPPHRHDALEVILCRQNSYTVNIGHDTIKMREGDILFIPARSLHQLIPPETGTRFIFLFDLSFLNVFYSGETVLEFLSVPHLYGIASHPNLQPMCHAILEKIIQIYFFSKEMMELSIKSQLLRLLSVLCQAQEEDHFSAQSSHTDNYDKFINILSYIDDNYAENLTLPQVSRTAGFSKYHFTRLFKQYTNTTFYDYLCRKRVFVAKELLAQKKSITDIAFQTGFNNQTTFCRCFKKYAGCSPTQYRSSLFSEVSEEEES